MMREGFSSFDDPGFSTEIEENESKNKQQQDTTLRLTSYVPPTTTWHKGFREHTEGYYVTEHGGIVTSQKLSEARAELYNAAFELLHKQGYR